MALTKEKTRRKRIHTKDIYKELSDGSAVNYSRATKLWSRSQSCVPFSPPMACRASCSFFRCSAFFTPSSCTICWLIELFIYLFIIIITQLQFLSVQRVLHANLLHNLLIDWIIYLFIYYHYYPAAVSFGAARSSHPTPAQFADWLNYLFIFCVPP